MRHILLFLFWSVRVQRTKNEEQASKKKRKTFLFVLFLLVSFHLDVRRSENVKQTWTSIHGPAPYIDLLQCTKRPVGALYISGIGLLLPCTMCADVLKSICAEGRWTWEYSKEEAQIVTKRCGAREEVLLKRNKQINKSKLYGCQNGNHYLTLTHLFTCQHVRRRLGAIKSKIWWTR